MTAPPRQAWTVASMQTSRMRTVYSPGWATNVVLGPGQADLIEVLRGIAARNPRHAWHDLPPTRTIGNSGTVSALLHRLAALGVIAIETRRGRYGGIRFTFRPRRWKWAPIVGRTVALARMKVREVGAGVREFLAGVVRPAQLALAHRPPDDVSPGIRAMLAAQPAAPTVQAVCVRCGALEDIRAGVFRDDSGRAIAGRFCLDHDACARRREQDARDAAAEAEFLRPIR